MFITHILHTRVIKWSHLLPAKILIRSLWWSFDHINIYSSSPYHKPHGLWSWPVSIEKVSSVEYTKSPSPMVKKGVCVLNTDAQSSYKVKIWQTRRVY